MQDLLCAGTLLLPSLLLKEALNTFTSDYPIHIATLPPRVNPVLSTLWQFFYLNENLLYFQKSGAAPH
jgi:hypothetical protein